MYTEKELREHVDEFADMIRQTQEFNDYVHMVEVLKRRPDLYDAVMVFRRENYYLQHAPEQEDIYDRVIELRDRNEELLNNPEVYDYLLAEWTFFHMLQNLFDRLMGELDL